MILVLGGCGQLGRALAARADANSVALTALGRDEADVTDPKSLALAIARTRPALIVNAAALTDVDQAEKRPAAAQRVNTLGATVVATAAKRAGIPLIHMSCASVFDGAKDGLYHESDKVAPLNVCGRSKAKGEDGVRNAHRHHLIIRSSWVYGVAGNGVLQHILGLAREKERFEVPANRRGSPTAIDDLAKAVLTGAKAAIAGTARWGTYHFAGPEATSYHDFAVAIVALQAPFTGRVPMVGVSEIDEKDDGVPLPANVGLDAEKFGGAFRFRAGDWRLSLEKVVNKIFASGEESCA